MGTNGYLHVVISGVENNFIHFKVMVITVIDGYLWLPMVITMYLKRMVKRRNKYISFCYRNGRRPVQPKTKINASIILVSSKRG